MSKDAELDAELAKWQVVIDTIGAQHSGLARVLLAEKSEAERIKIVRAAFHGRAPTTLRGHVGALNQYVRWAGSVLLPPFPLSELKKWQYVPFLEETKAPPTRADS